MEAVTKILFLDEHRDKFFGEGPYRLLAGIEETGSLRKSAISMGMAYSKAMKIIKHAEQSLGFPLTDRTAGGVSGGGSRLTPQGKEWIGKYAAYRDACVEANRRLYLEFFPEQREEAPAADRNPRVR